MNTLPRRITIANTKGGVGKTLSAIMLAMALTNAGHTIEVWDADPQGSASAWAEDAADAGDPLPFPVIAINARTIRRPIPTGVDFVLVDTPPGDAAIVQAAIDTADRVLIPTLASPRDIERTWLTLDVAEHRDPAILITQAEPHTTAFRDTVTALREGGAPLMNTSIIKTTRIKPDTVRRPHNTWGYERVATELIQETR